MLKSKAVDGENRPVQVARGLQTQAARRLWVARRHLQPLPVILATLPVITCGPARMTSRRSTTTTAPRAPTTTSKARRKICPAPTVARLRQLFGVVTCVGKWCATRAACTLSCMASIDHTRCAVTRFILVDVAQRVTSLTEEVSLPGVTRLPRFLIDFLIFFCRVKKPRKSRTRGEWWC